MSRKLALAPRKSLERHARLRRPLRLGLPAHAATVAAKLWRQPFQFNSDIWLGLSDAAVLCAAHAHGVRVPGGQ